MKTYNLFISHSWQHGDQYGQLCRLLLARRYFGFKDYSVPKDDPIHYATNNAQLRQAIRDQMRPCHVVLILAGVYASYSKWINIEIDLAENGFQQPKPTIAIWPRGNTVISRRVREAAQGVVRWNTESIVQAIRKLG